MKIIGWNGSPRNSGNTAWTVGKILEGARAAGAETEVYNTSDLNIQPCRGCLGCVKIDRCVMQDDMQQLYDALKTADALVLGSPVYMGQMSGQTKIFTDRLFAQIHPRFSPQFNEEHAAKKLVLAFTQGNPDPGLFQTYYDYTKRMFQLLEFDVQDIVVVAGMRSEQACGRAGLHADMMAAGAALATDGAKEAAGR